MPYNISKAVVNRSIRYLDDMLNARKTINWPAHDPRKFAYRIREAMYAAKRHKDFSKYHSLHDDFRIREYPGYVEAEYIGIPTEASQAVAPQGITVEEATDAQGIVGACIKFGPRADELRFPMARLSEEEKLIVYKWAMAERPAWRLIDHEDNGVTLTRRSGLDEIFFWRPTE